MSLKITKFIKKIFGVWFVILVFDFWALNCCNAQEAATREAREHFSAGKKLMREGSYAAADEEFKKAQEILKSSSGDLASGLSGAQASRETGAAKSKKITKERYLEPGKSRSSPPEDISYYLEAVKKNPGDSDLHYNLAVVYLKNNQYADAAGSLKKAVSLNPKDKNAYYNLAVLYEGYLNDKKQALEYYSRYLRLSSKAEDTREIKSWMNQIKKELKESKPHD